MSAPEGMTKINAGEPAGASKLSEDLANDPERTRFIRSLLILDRNPNSPEARTALEALKGLGALRDIDKLPISGATAEIPYYEKYDSEYIGI